VANIVRLPLDYFPDPTKGKPVFNGQVFIGNPDTDPEVVGNRKAVTLRQEDGTDVPVTGPGQPLVTGQGGVVLYNGSPVQVFTSGNYSIKVLNSKGTQVYFVENVLDGEPLTSNTGTKTTSTVAIMTADGTASPGEFYSSENYTATNNSGVLFFEVVDGAAPAPDGGSQIDHDTLAIHFVQNFPRNISWKAFGATGDGVKTNEHVEIQACLDHAKTINRPCYGPAGTYLCNAEITHETGDLFNNRPDNGITFIGDGIGRTILKAEDTFAGSLLVLDGNVNDTSDNFNPVVQVSNFIAGFSLVGNGQFSGNPLSNGMRIRANQRCHFGQIMIKEWTQHGLFIDGTTVATKDDADTTQQCSFKDFHVHECNSYGIIAPNSRTSTLSFDTCEIRNNTNDGFRMGYSGLRFKNVSFVGNGVAGNSTGGFTTIIPATGAISRGLVILGCESENNFNHEIRLDYCDGFSITGSRFGAFKNDVGAGGQRVFKFGDGTGTSIVRGAISGCQLANLGNNGGYGHTVYSYDCDDECDGVSIDNVGIGTNYVDFLISSGAKGITRNGAELTATPNKPGFSVTMAQNAADVTNVTGDGTVYTAASLHAAATMTEYYNSGDYNAGVFTAPEQGMYGFNVSWPCTGFDGTESEARARITTSGGGVYVVQDLPIQGMSLVATSDITVGGQVSIFLAKGETVNFHLIVAGAAAKLVDLYRNSADIFNISGVAL
jgi:hypothetical protein